MLTEKSFLTLIKVLTYTLIVGKLSAQEFYVLNSSNKTPIAYANADFLNGRGTNSDLNGKFVIETRPDSIKITSMGFKTLLLSFNDLLLKKNIFLDENPVKLSEVSLTNRKNKILKHKGKPGLGIFYRDFTYDEKVITYIPYPDIKSDNVTINKIIVNSTGFNSKKRKNLPFKVNLYKTRPKSRPPFLNDSILTGIVTRRKKGYTGKVKINVEKYNIQLPVNGIFVSFETLGKSYYPNDSIYRYTKKLGWGYWHPYSAIGVKTIKSKKGKSKSYSYTLKRKSYLEIDVREIDEAYWTLEKDFIYDITIEISY